MKQADVKVGGEYVTRISGARCRVTVASGPHESMSGRADFFYVQRGPRGRQLIRTARALEPVAAKPSPETDPEVRAAQVANADAGDRARATAAEPDYANCSDAALEQLANYGRDYTVRRAAAEHLKARQPKPVAATSLPAIDGLVYEHGFNGLPYEAHVRAALEAAYRAGERAAVTRLGDTWHKG